MTRWNIVAAAVLALSGSAVGLDPLEELRGPEQRKPGAGRRQPGGKRGRAKAKPRTKQREGLVEQMLAGPLGEVEEVVFAERPYGNDGHWYANFGWWSSDREKKLYGIGGRLAALNPRTGKVRTILADETGGIRDPQVHYDGRKILFSYRPGGTEHYHLYEIDADGKNLRRLTDGDFDDIEPTYLPDGDIVFCSSRCFRYVQCWFTHVAVLYRCGPDGKNVRRISANVEHDNTPWPLPDGRILFMRWEYVDRSQVRYHHLWTANPDGTAVMTFFGNMHPGLVMIDAKPIPPRPGSSQAGTRKVVAVFSPGHGRRSHAGHIAIIDPDCGPDDTGRAREITDKPEWRDPYALDANCFLVARNNALYVMNAAGEYEALYRIPTRPDATPAELREGLMAHEPRPLRPRRRERIIAPRCDPGQATGKLMLADVTIGRNMAGVGRGEIKKLLILESLPKPVNFSGGMDAVSPGGTFTIPRILGTVPVEPDGSAYFEVPALRPVFFVALDENDLSVKRMQSFVSVMPGETTGCVGCHEHRTEAPPVAPAPPAGPVGSVLATRKPPATIAAFDGLPDVMDFTRDIQPIVDRHCVRCHDGTEPGRPDLRYRRESKYANWPGSYTCLFKLVAQGANADGNRAPRTLGSSASPLMDKLARPGRAAPKTNAKGHPVVPLTEREWRTVWLWVEAGAHYPGTYAALGTGGTGMYVARDVLVRRCGDCHGHTAEDGSTAVSFKTPHLELWDFDDPPRSIALRAPLARKAGGLGLCRGEYTVYRDGTRSPARKPSVLARKGPADDEPGGLDLSLDDVLGSGSSGKDLPKAVEGPETKPVPGVFFSDTDPDYRELLSMVRNRRTWRGRIDMPIFRPNDHYIREMKRYGILDESYTVDQPLDVYALDRAYWRSFWYRPQER